MGKGGIVPGAQPPRKIGSRRRGGEQAAAVCWSPAFREEADKEFFLQMAASMPVLALGTHVAEEGDLSSREEAGGYVLYSFLQAVMTAEIKNVVAAHESVLSPYKANYRRGYSPLTELWWNSLLTGSRDIPVQGTPAEVTELLAVVNETAGHEVPHFETEEARSGQLSLGLRLEPPAEESELWQLTFWAESREEGNSGFRRKRCGAAGSGNSPYGASVTAIFSSSFWLRWDGRRRVRPTSGARWLNRPRAGLSCRRSGCISS